MFGDAVRLIAVGVVGGVVVGSGPKARAWEAPFHLG